jgi:hypothetical protein
MGFRLYFLSLTFLLTGLQSPAQRHGRRHEKPVRNTNRLPDSVSTSDEEIKPFSPDDVNSTGNGSSANGSSSEVSSGSVRVDSSQSSVQPGQDSVTGNTDSSAAETPEPAPVLRKIPDTAINKWKNSHDFDYANDPSLWKQEPQEKEGLVQRIFDSDAFRWFIYLLLGSVLIYVLYKIISDNNLRFFYRKPVRFRKTIVEEAELPEEDLEQLLKKAVAGKEYRLATRYFYLKTLRHLDKRELIRWHIQTTDEEYLRQMDARPQGARFRWLTSVYERVWYGKFPMDEYQFNRLSQYFQDFHKDIDHPHHS